MRRLTNETVLTDIINNIIPLNTIFREKLIKTVNNSYQFSSISFREYNNGNYQWIKDLYKKHLLTYL